MRLNNSNIIAQEALQFYNNRRYIEAASKFVEAGNGSLSLTRLVETGAPPVAVPSP